MRIDAHVVTDRGRLKENNEDHGATFFENRLLVVADGMGGGVAGEYASKQAVDQIREVVSHAKFYQDGVGVREEGIGRLIGSKGLEAAVQHANTFLYSISRTQENLKGMGTTVVCCLVESNRAYFANLGDSRGYLFRAGRLTQVTRDHSLFSDPKYNKSNVITRALGQKSYAEVDLFEEPLQPGDVILLCSDGLDKVVPDERVAAVLARKDVSPVDLAIRLVEMANAGGGPDNITAVVARVEGELDELAGAPPAAVSAADEPTVDDGPPAEVASHEEKTEVVDIRGSIPAAPPASEEPEYAEMNEPALEAVGPTTVRPAEQPQEEREKPRGRGLLMVLLASAFGLIVVIAVVIGFLQRAPAVASSDLAVELRKTRSEVVPGARIVVKDGAEEIWVAEVVPAGPEQWELQVVAPRSARGEHRADFGEVIRLPASVRADRGAVLTIINTAGEDRVLEKHVEPLTRLWDVGQRAYGVLVETRAYSQAVRGIWDALVEHGLTDAEIALDGLASQLNSRAEIMREQAWFAEVERGYWDVQSRAEELDAVLAGEGLVHREDVLSLQGDMEQAAERLDRFCPIGAGPLAPRLPDLELLKERERLAALLEALPQIERERENLRAMIRSGSAEAEEMEKAAADFEELVADVGLEKTAEEIRLVDDARQSLAPAEQATGVEQSTDRDVDRRP